MRAYIDGTEIPLGESFTEYSLEEQVAGRWIDGKPVYRKTYSGLTVPDVNTDIVDITALNVDRTIFIYGSIGQDVTFPVYTGSWGFSAFLRTSEGSRYIRFSVVNPSTEQIGMDLVVTILYTKSTDQATIKLPTTQTNAASFSSETFSESASMNDVYNELANGDDTPVESSEQSEVNDTPMESSEQSEVNDTPMESSEQSEVNDTRAESVYDIQDRTIETEVRK